jgi:phenylacetate-CoA ligase
VNVFPTQIEEIVLQHASLSGQYLLHLTRDGLLDALEVRCEWQAGQSDTSTEAEQRLATALGERIKAMIGISARILILPHATLERNQAGKARRVVDLRTQGAQK